MLVMRRFRLSYFFSYVTAVIYGYILDLIMWLKDLGPLGNAIMCAIIPFITIAGLGGANLSAMLLLASTGVDPILFFANVLYNNILGAVTFALYLKNSLDI